MVSLTIALVSSAHFFLTLGKEQYFYIILLPSPGRIECQEVARLYRLHVELEDLEYQNTVHALPKKRGRYRGRYRGRGEGEAWRSYGERGEEGRWDGERGEEGRWDGERGRESGRDISDCEVPENLT